GTGTLSAEAFETAFEADIVAAEKELREYIRREQLSFFRYTPEKQLEERSVEVQRLAHKETLFLLGDLLAHQLPVRGEAAEQHLRAALALDESYVDASVALAMLRFLQQRPDEAVALASEAIALDPEHPRALVIRGMSRLMQFFVEYESESAEAENHKQVLLLAREDFRTKLKRSPDDVSALIGLGETYVLEGEDPQEGISALAQASAARPARTDVLSKLIALTARSGNIAGAENLLAIGLRPRGDVDSIAIAEDALVREQMKEVDRLLRDNDPEQALSLARKIAGGITTEIVRRPLTKWIAGASAEYRAELLRREAIAAGAAGDKERARELMQQAGATYGDDGQGTTERNRFNAAIQLMNQGQYETALEQFEQIARSKSGSVANERSIEHAKELRRIISHNRNVARLNTALETIKAGAADRAISLLLEVLEDDLDNQLRVEAERLLREARRRAKVPD
ncbi:MAG: hypothetical protein GY722_05815, partial [bacterium]|nr:hypothetical protein [bacterium]